MEQLEYLLPLHAALSFSRRLALLLAILQLHVLLRSNECKHPECSTRLETVEHMQLQSTTVASSLLGAYSIWQN